MARPTKPRYRPKVEYIAPWKFFLALTPFSLGAAGLLGLAMHDIVLWQRAKSWVARPSTILEVDLQSVPGRRGRKTSKVVARYRYEFNGVMYENDRVAIFPGSDNSGFPEVMARSLKDARRQGFNVWCYVNPASPQEALLYRKLRPPILILWLVLGGACAWAVAHVLRVCQPDWRGRGDRENAGFGLKP